MFPVVPGELLQAGFLVQRGVQRATQGGVQRLLGQFQSVRGALGKALGVGLHVGRKGVVGVDMLAQAHAQGFFRRDLLGQGHQLEGPVVAHQPG